MKKDTTWIINVKHITATKSAHGLSITLLQSNSLRQIPHVRVKNYAVIYWLTSILYEARKWHNGRTILTNHTTQSIDVPRTVGLVCEMGTIAI